MVSLAAEPAASVSVFENNVLCVRAGHLTENFSEQLRSFQPTNKISGTVLDLRFADGDNTAADATAKFFSAKKSPLVILVNGQTRGAAEDLAVRLRAAGAGLIIGSIGAPGKISPDITVAVSADDEKKFLENPFAYAMTNTATSLSLTNDLVPFVDHMSEAELVRKRIKDGEDEGDTTMPRAEPSQPVIRDPALARAVDLIKALAVLHASRG